MQLFGRLQILFICSIWGKNSSKITISRKGKKKKKPPVIIFQIDQRYLHLTYKAFVTIMQKSPKSRDKNRYLPFHWYIFTYYTYYISIIKYYNIKNAPKKTPGK